MMTKMPVAGVVWQTLHYLVGFRRLGFDVYYVEAHARTPSMFMRHEADDSSGLAADFLQRVMTDYGFRDRWAFHALHDGGACYGLSLPQLLQLYRDAALILNLHGGTEPLEEHAAADCLVYLETDPVQLQIELHDNVRETIEFLKPHHAFFTFGENLGNPDCGLPVSEEFPFIPTRQPVILDFWDHGTTEVEPSFTTIGNWQQEWREVLFNGVVYRWSKHEEFLKILELPQKAGAGFELALSSYAEEDRELLVSHGWRVRPGLEISTDLDVYRSYIQGSFGELTVAKDQNVRLRSGWFSDRSATYLASGRPVVTQETGFSNVLPSGQGLIGFSNLDEAVAAVDSILQDYRGHASAALAIAHSHFDHHVVLGALLDAVGLLPSRSRPADPRFSCFPEDLVLEPISRRPVVLPEATVATVASGRIDRLPTIPGSGGPGASVIVPTHNNLIFTRMCLETVLADASHLAELIVVDNASHDGTLAYLSSLQEAFPIVRVIANIENRGFAAAVNQGLREAQGSVLVLLNNDTVVSPGWLARLIAHADSPQVGAVSPVTNRIGTEAEVDVSYRTYGELCVLAERRAREHDGVTYDVEMLAMFCLAIRRDVLDQVGFLDEGYGMGLFEDDDFSYRLRQLGFRLVLAEDAFVHHVGEASFGNLVQTGEYSRLFETNRVRFEEKWGVVWSPHQRRQPSSYLEEVSAVRRCIETSLPVGASFAVISRGDEELVDIGDGRRGRHFPSGSDEGDWAGCYPESDDLAIAHLEELRLEGLDYLVIPHSSRWWLDHYRGFARHLVEDWRLVLDQGGVCSIFSSCSSPKHLAEATTNWNMKLVRPQIASTNHPSWSPQTKRRVLVMGVYLSDHEHLANDVVSMLSQSNHCDVVQRWVGLGDTVASGKLFDVTVFRLPQLVPKFQILQGILDNEDLSTYDYVLVIDDDVVVPHGFLDGLVGAQESCGFSLAQPARTSESFIDHEIVRQVKGLAARETRFVEIGPVFNVHRSAYAWIFPFDQRSPMGWGYENVWSYRLGEVGLSMGIIDSVPVDHSLRKPVENYTWLEADGQRLNVLAETQHLPLSACYKVLRTVPFGTAPF